MASSHYATLPSLQMFTWSIWCQTLAWLCPFVVMRWVSVASSQSETGTWAGCASICLLKPEFFLGSEN